MIKLVLSDLDSTLLWQGDQHIATPFALEAIHALQDAGVHFAPATGRIYRDLDVMFAGDSRAYSTAVTSNGQLVYLDGELVDSTPMAREGLEGVRHALADVPDAYLVVEYGGQKMAVDAPLDFVLAHPDNFWHVEQVLPEVPNEPCFKANVRVTSKDFSRALEVRDALAARFASMEFTCPMPGVGHLDLTPKGFGKEHGGDFLMERLGLSPDEDCCFGDTGARTSSGACGLRGLLLWRCGERPRPPLALPQLRRGGKCRARRQGGGALARGPRQRGVRGPCAPGHCPGRRRGTHALVHAPVTRVGYHASTV